MNKITVKKFVKDHQIAISIVAGVAVGALAVYSRYHGRTLLELPTDAAKYMKETNSRVLYDVPKEGRFVLTFVPSNS